MKEKVTGLITFLVLVFLYYYFLLPPIHLQSIAFWAFVVYALVVGGFCFGFSALFAKRPRVSLVSGICFGGIMVIILLILAINFIYSPIFMSGMYSERIKIDENGDFGQDIAEVDFQKIPLLDKVSSTKLGDRVMGQMPEMVSQFYVSDLYTQINYQNQIVRVTPLEYNGFFIY